MNTQAFHRVVLLFDIYQSLLTKKQKTIMEKRFLEDFSLSEIAEGLSISRSAVQDTLQKTLQKLELYESNLELLKSQNYRQDIIKLLEETSLSDTQKELIQKLKDVM